MLFARFLLPLAAVAACSSDPGTGPDGPGAIAPADAPYVDCSFTADVDVGVDGSVEFRQSGAFNAQGKPTFHELGQGPNDPYIEWTYDEEGRVLERVSETSSGAQRTVYFYDDETGLLTHSEWDLEDDGTPEERTDYTLDEDGNIVVEEIDEFLDGSYERRAEYTFEGGVTTLVEVDANMDGEVDVREDFTWDGVRLLSVESTASFLDWGVLTYYEYTSHDGDRWLTNQYANQNDHPNGDWTGAYSRSYECP